MDGDCRAAIRQASRFGITVEVAEKREDLNDFVALHSSTWNRTGSDAHELDYFTAMWDHFHGIGAMKVLFALHQEKRIAAVIIHVFKDAAFYWAGCSEFASLKLRPNNILLWEAMREARANGAKWFEVGYFYAAPGPSRKEYNIGKYKSQFGSDQLIPFEGQKIYHPVRVLGLELLRQIKPGLKQLLKRGE